MKLKYGILVSMSVFVFALQSCANLSNNHEAFDNCQYVDTLKMIVKEGVEVTLLSTEQFDDGTVSTTDGGSISNCVTVKFKNNDAILNFCYEGEGQAAYWDKIVGGHSEYINNKDSSKRLELVHMLHRVNEDFFSEKPASKPYSISKVNGPFGTYDGFGLKLFDKDVQYDYFRFLGENNGVRSSIGYRWQREIDNTPLDLQNIECLILGIELELIN